MLAFGAHLEAVAAASEVLAAMTPIEPDWHVATMGTLPARQGQGLGSAVLRPVVERCDDTSLIAGLENERRAQHLVLRTARIRGLLTVSYLPHGAPTTWIMQRLPVQAPRVRAV